MSIDFYNCEICKQSIYEEYCYGRIIGGNFIYVCDNCIDKMQVESFSEDDDDYENYSDEIKDYIDDYGEYYEYTEEGKKDEIKRLDKEIEILQSRRNSLIEKENK